jgi:hypothetical protein
MKKILTIGAILLLPVLLFGQDLIPFKSNGLWGYRDSLGTIVIEPNYQIARKFRGKYAVITHNNLLGAIDKSNNLIISSRHEFLEYIGDKYFKFGSRAKYVGEFNLGIISSKKEVIISPEYSDVSFKNDNFFVTKETYEIIDSDGIYDTRKVTSKYGIIDTFGNVILEPIYGRIKLLKNGYMAINKELNGKFALFDKSYNKLTEFEYKSIGEFYDGLSVVGKEGFCGYLNLSGKEEIKCKYKRCRMFIDSIAVVTRNDAAGIIDTNDDVILDFEFRMLGVPYKNQIPAIDSMKFGMINMNGETILPFEYERKKSEFNGITAFLKDEKWQVWSYEEQRILPDKYDELTITERDIINVLGFGKIKEKKYSQSLAFVRVKERWGIINAKGEILIPIEFTRKEVFEKIKTL